MAAFTTVQAVRYDSGFAFNPDITDESIQASIDRAHAEVLSFAGAKYNINDLSGANFTGSQAEHYLKSAELMLASAYALISEYGSEQEDTDKGGYKKRAEAYSMLKQITAKPPLRLIGNDGVELPSMTNSSSAGGIDSRGLKDTTPFFTRNETW